MLGLVKQADAAAGKLVLSEARTILGQLQGDGDAQKLGYLVKAFSMLVFYAVKRCGCEVSVIEQVCSAIADPKSQS